MIETAAGENTKHATSTLEEYLRNAGPRETRALRKAFATKLRRLRSTEEPRSRFPGSTGCIYLDCGHLEYVISEGATSGEAASSRRGQDRQSDETDNNTVPRQERPEEQVVLSAPTPVGFVMQQIVVRQRESAGNACMDSGPGPAL